MRTARDLIIDAYREASIVSDNDVPEGFELAQGLKQLNDMIDIWNLDGLWPFTNLIISYDFTTGGSSFTIGDDGVQSCTVTGVSANLVTLTVSDSSVFSSSVYLRIDDVDYQGTLDSVASGTSIVVDITTHNIINGDTGIVKESVLPDIYAQRPNKIKNIRLLIGNAWYPLNQTRPVTYDNRAIFENVKSIPKNFTYRTNYPYGVIDFNEGFSTGYSGEIIYNSLITSYEYDDKIILPVGYEATLLSNLAANLSDLKNFDNPTLAAKASGRLRALKKNNIEIPELDLSGGRLKYSPWTDRNE